MQKYARARCGVKGVCWSAAPLGVAALAGCFSGGSTSAEKTDANLQSDSPTLDASGFPDGGSADSGFLDGVSASDGPVTGEAGSETGVSDSGTPCTGDGGPGTFTCVGDMGTARMAAGIAPLPGGKALVAGGWNATDKTLTSAEVYDSTSGTFAPTGSMSAPHLWGAWGLGWPTLPGGKVLAAGGLDGTGALLGSAEVYDSAAGTFSSTGPLLKPVISMFALVLQDTSVLLVGGWDSTTGAVPTPGWMYTTDGTSAVQRYSPSAGTFSEEGPLAEHRLNGCNVLLADGDVLAIGGFIGLNGNEPNIEKYDPVLGTWTTLGTLSAVPFCGQAFPIPGGKVLMVATGSAANADVLDPVALTSTGTVGFLAGWVPVYQQLQNGDVLAYGGALNGTVTATAMVYSAATNAWRSVGPMDQARGNAPSATLLTTGDVLVVGGTDVNAVQLNTAEIYHP